jgi:hypothetical protein
MSEIKVFRFRSAIVVCLRAFTNCMGNSPNALIGGAQLLARQLPVGVRHAMLRQPPDLRRLGLLSLVIPKPASHNKGLPLLDGPLQCLLRHGV